MYWDKIPEKHVILTQVCIFLFADVPLSPVLSVMSDKEFDLSGCDSGIEAEFDDPHGKKWINWSKKILYTLVLYIPSEKIIMTANA